MTLGLSIDLGLSQRRRGASIPATAPDAITDLVAFAGDEEALLIWTAPANNGAPITDNLVEYKLRTEPTTWTTFAHAPSTATAITVTGLTNDLLYDFRVSAINSVDTALPSNIASITPGGAEDLDDLEVDVDYGASGFLGVWAPALDPPYTLSIVTPHADIDTVIHPLYIAFYADPAFGSGEEREIVVRGENDDGADQRTITFTAGLGRLADWTTGTYTGIAPTNTMASGGFAKTLDGDLTWFLPHTLRRTDRGLLCEPPGANYLLRSQEFDNNAAWTKSGLVVHPNAAVAPDGTTTADKLEDTAATIPHVAYQSTSPGAGACIVSEFFSPAGRNFAFLQIVTDGGTKRFGIVADLTTGAVTSTSTVGSPVGVSYGVETYLGMYRLWVKATNTSGTVFSNKGPVLTGTPSYDANGQPVYTGTNQGVYAWGSMLDKASVLSSYIPTAATTVNRSADQVQFTIPASVTGNRETLANDNGDETTADVTGLTPGATRTMSNSYAPLYIKYTDAI